jgi:hypothetical protein
MKVIAGEIRGHMMRRKLSDCRDVGSNVVNPRNPFMMNPAMMHFISLIPLPAAYGANPRTKNAETNANTT